MSAKSRNRRDGVGYALLPEKKEPSAILKYWLLELLSSLDSLMLPHVAAALCGAVDAHRRSACATKSTEITIWIPFLRSSRHENIHMQDYTRLHFWRSQKISISLLTCFASFLWMLISERSDAWQKAWHSKDNRTPWRCQLRIFVNEFRVGSKLSFNTEIGNLHDWGHWALGVLEPGYPSGSILLHTFVQLGLPKL